MGSSTSCCVARKDAEHLEVERHRHESWCSLPDIEEQWAFFECSETEEEMQDSDAGHCHSPSRRGSPKRGDTWYKLRANSMPLPLTSLQVGENESQPLLSLIPFPFEDSIPLVIQNVRAAWSARMAPQGKNGRALDEDLMEKLDAGFVELDEWTTPITVRRYLRAIGGDVAQATQMLDKAIEYRVRKRELFDSLHCDVACDMRVIGRDSERRPTIYMCAGSQHCSLKETIPQFFLAFEAAVRLGQPDGQVILIADMHRFSPGRNTDASAWKELAEWFGCVFADRLNFILLVDFSFVAQGIWSMVKRMNLVTERTQHKINMVNEYTARGIVKDKFESRTCKRILSSFDINRDRLSTEEQRAEHAKRTSICDVPLGQPVRWPTSP